MILRCEICEQVVELREGDSVVVCHGRPLEGPDSLENHGPMEEWDARA